MALIDIREGCCLSVLPTLPPASVDAIVTDPPYGQSNEDYDSDVSYRSEVWRECFRVAKADAALLSFTGLSNYHRIASRIEGAGWKVRQMWAWVYRDGMPMSAFPKDGFDRLVPAMDPIVFATKGKVVLHTPREGDPWHATRKTAGYSKRAGLCTTTAGKGHYPRQVVSDGSPGWEYFAHSRTNGYRAERVGHPNQKPLALMRWLIAKLPGGRVLDPFAGSGTTGLAASDLGKASILVEIDPGFCAIIRERVAAAQRSLFFNQWGSD